MSRRRNLEHHLQSLAEIRNILNAIKSLAYMETRKLARFLDAQHAVVRSMEDVAADLLSFYPAILPERAGALPVFLLIGTERGFCGDYNHALLMHLDSALQTYPQGIPAVLAIGRKLHSLLEGDARVLGHIGGASVVEETTSVLNELADQILALQRENSVLDIFCLCHGGDDGITVRKILPPFETLLPARPRFSHPPTLNLAPAVFLAELTDQYLFACLHSILYTSLMMENQYRITHLESAVEHLDDQSEDLARQYNALRQEEIIEEIEVILLNSDYLGERPASSATALAHPIPGSSDALPAKPTGVEHA